VLTDVLIDLLGPSYEGDEREGGEEGRGQGDPGLICVCMCMGITSLL
jgi:hypothetical protein